MQIVSYLNEWSKEIDKRQVVSVVYLDLAKAFDNVPYGILIAVSDILEICGKVFNWITVFIAGQTQVIRINNVLSEEVAVRSDVPRGSCLNPLMFLFYVNGVADVVETCKLCPFEDDCKICFSHKPHDSLAPLQNDLLNVHHWFTETQLELSFLA